MNALLRITTFCCLTLSAYSQTRETKANPLTLRQALVSFSWTWNHVKGPPAEVRFYKNGVATNPNAFMGTWEVTGLRSVTITRNDNRQKALLTFDPTFSTFEGVHFDGTIKVSGGRKAPADPEAILPTKPK